MRLTLPNILTFIRLAAAPAVALVYLVLPRPWADWAALALFIGAALTDYVDGWLARWLGQVSRLGAMLDPIADKAMVVIALALVVALSGMSGWVLLPAVAILFREVFVSGLREYLGHVSGTLKVTRLAKWKTTVQMVAISVLLAQGILAHHVGMLAHGMGEAMFAAVISGTEPDLHGLRELDFTAVLAWYLGLALLWLAAALTLVTGWDYFRKALPHLIEEADL
jgi:CDP-diacylglycerol--glycerol-3-phosphate 3-phosphatidyltransferase